MADFKVAIPFVLQHEGGYVHDPEDAGGETKYGICKRSYPKVDIAKLTEEKARDIYERDFWQPLGLDGFKSQEVATKVFDSAVLIGSKRAIIFLQRAVQNAGGGIVPVDGKMGASTIAAVNASSPDLLLMSYRHFLVTYYEGLVETVPTNKKFLKGWVKRANS